MRVSEGMYLLGCCTRRNSSIQKALELELLSCSLPLESLRLEEINQLLLLLLLMMIFRKKGSLFD